MVAQVATVGLTEFKFVFVGMLGVKVALGKKEFDPIALTKRRASLQPITRYHSLQRTVSINKVASCIFGKGFK